MPYFLITVIFLLSACSNNPYNPTAYDYQIDSRITHNPEFKRVIIAPVNFGKPTRLYIVKHEPYVDAKITRYLEKHGFTVLPSRLFETRWEEATRQYGRTYNPSTGKLTKAHKKVLAATLKSLVEDTNADGVIFTDLIERKVQFTVGVNHLARWDGVSRKPPLQGSGEGVPMDFNWAQEVDAISLWVTIFDRNLQQVFTSLGGIEIAQAIDLKASKPGFIRRRTVLGHESQIEEGIELAFHPLIKMKNYPQREP